MHDVLDTPDAPAPSGEHAERPALLYGAKSIARHVGVSEHTARHLVDRGPLPVFRLGGRLVARPETINAWLAEREQKALVAADR